MPNALVPRDISTLSEYMTFVESQSSTRWYRGCGDIKHDLLPSLYRLPNRDGKAFAASEQLLLERFKNRSITYLPTLHSTDPENIYTLFLMQHYGIPTRLLDWTENPYIGLFFALTAAPYEKDDQNQIEYKNDASVWVLDPNEWNNFVYKLDDPPGIVSPTDGKLAKGHLPTTDYELRRREPIAVYGIHNNPRIVAQKGVSVIFGTDITPMDQAFQQQDFPVGCLQKLIIRRESIEPLLMQLIRIGVTDTVVYPDLGGLSAELKREFGYW